MIELVRADAPPAGYELTGRERRVARRQTRREFMRVVTVGAVGTGLAFAGLFPTARPAYATHNTPSTTTNGCYANTTSSTGCCNCGSYVSSSNCGGDNWHHHHKKYYSSTTNWYRLRRYSCHNKNAWFWTKSGNKWRCSDGKYRVCGSSGCSSYWKSVCPKNLG